MGLGAKVWVHQVLVQCHKQLRALELHCGPALQRDFEPDGSSLDLQEEVSEEDWASPTPDKEHTCKKKNLNLSPPGGTHSQTISSEGCIVSSSLRPQDSPYHAAGNERNCHVVLIFRRLRS